MGIGGSATDKVHVDRARGCTVTFDVDLRNQVQLDECAGADAVLRLEACGRAVVCSVNKPVLDGGVATDLGGDHIA